MTGAPPDLWLPSQSQSVPAFLAVYTLYCLGTILILGSGRIDGAGQNVSHSSDRGGRYCETTDRIGSSGQLGRLRLTDQQ